MTGPARDEIRPLWPTWIGQLDLPGAQDANGDLIALATSTDQPDNLFESGHRAAVWLRNWVNASVGDWFEHAKVQAPPRWRAQGRLDALGFGHYRELANAPGAYLAGLYFANVPAAPELDHLRSDCAASHVSFLDPRVGFNALALQGDPHFDETRTIVPVAGRLMLWPGYLRYCSRVHLSRTNWVRVAIRVDLEDR